MNVFRAGRPEGLRRLWLFQELRGSASATESGPDRRLLAAPAPKRQKAGMGMFAVAAVMGFSLLLCTAANAEAIQRNMTYDRFGPGGYHVGCYGNPFLPLSDHYCVGHVGFDGRPALAAGGDWGELTLLVYMGSVRHVGRAARCEAKAGDDVLPGRLYVDVGHLSAYLIDPSGPPGGYGRRHGTTDDDLTHCAFQWPASRRLLEAARVGVVYVRAATQPDSIVRIGPDTLLPAGLADFEAVVPRRTTSRFSAPSTGGLPDR